MIPTAFNEDNGTIGPPQGMTEDQVSSLSVNRGFYKLEDGTEIPVITTAWKPDKDELIALQNGGYVYLIIMGWTMSPVIMDGLNPFNQKRIRYDPAGV